MPDPYRMIVVNLIFSTLLLLGIIAYKYVYPKRNINLFFLLILVSFLPLISVLREGSYESGDLSLHAGLAMSFYESLKEGVFIPRWSSEMIYGYGYPLFLFAYPLPYYLTAFFHFLGFSFVNSLKIILAFSFITSGITMYFFIKEEIKNKFSAFIAALFYLFSPYHLVDLHFRVAIGEVIAFAILPFCFLTIKKMSENLTFRWFFLSSVSFSLLILSHQAISLISTPFIAIYCLYLFLNKNKKKFYFIFNSIFSLIFGIILSSFYWLPAILEAKYTNLLTKGVVSFISLDQLFYSPWGWGFLFQGHKGELSFIVGYVEWAIILFSIYLFFKKLKEKFKEKNLYLISLISFLILLFLTQSVSSPIWKTVPLINSFQFSFRLLLLTSFFMSIIAGIVIKNIPNKQFLIALCLLAVTTTMLNWGNRKMLPLLTDSAILHDLPQTMAKIGPGTTIWVNSDKFNINQRVVPHMDILQGKANITEGLRGPNKHAYSIRVTSGNAAFKENTLYFPNWIVKVNGNLYPFSFMNPNYPGVITFNLDKGLYRVEVIFQDTNVRKLSSLISLSSFIILLAFGLMRSGFPKF